MTSGQFASVPIARIWVDRLSRQRRELKDIPSLADSIKRTGLIHPIVITRDFELKAGERRFEACKLLGWTNISAQWYDEVSPSHLLLLELEENIKRVDITWQENCQAIYRYHQLRLSMDPSWTATRTAEEIGESIAGVVQKLLVIREAEKDKRLIEAPKLSTAINTVRRTINRRHAAAAESIAPTASRSIPFVNADFLTYKFDRQFNFIHCDFPYGIDQQNHDKQASGDLRRYEDGFDVYKACLDKLADVPIHPSAHIMFWFSMRHYQFTYEALTSQGWTIDRFPLIWSKGNDGLLPDPQRGPRRVYETALYGYRGDRKIVTSVNNHIFHPSANEIHPSEKPRPVLEYFFRMFVDEYSIVLDPTCGSGNAIKTAEKLGAQYAIGLEKDQEFFEDAARAYRAD